MKLVRYYALTAQYTGLENTYQELQSKTTATENELDLALKRLQESNEAAAVVDEVRADLSRTQADHQRKLATLEEAKLRKEADYDQKTNELQQALERSQLTEVSLLQASRTKINMKHLCATWR